MSDKDVEVVSKAKPKRIVRPMNISQLDIRVARINDVQHHTVFPNECFLADTHIGDETKTYIIPTNLKRYAPDYELDETYVLVVCNLPKVKMYGYESNVMILCAFSDYDCKAEVLRPDKDARVGERVVVEGYEPPTKDRLRVVGKTVFDKVAKDLLVNNDYQVVYKGIPLKSVVSEGFITTKKLNNCSVKYV